MKKRTLLPLLVVSLLLAAVLWPPPARMQQRGLTTGAGGAAANAGRYYALVIGNNAYTSLPKLKTAEADAHAVERLLRETYGFQTKLLVNATRGQIVAALSAYRRELTPDANLLIYYAGHGFNDKDADKAYWLPVDATIDDSSNWIIADEITTGIRVVPAKHVLVISDSCYSGTLTRGLSDMLPRTTGREQFLQRMAAGHSRTLMASGGDEPVADNGGGGHSVFAAALLRGLQEMDKGQFTAAELFNSYVIEAVAGRAEQTPVYDPLRNSGHESGDFIFVRVKTGDKTVEVTVKTPPAPAFDPAAIELSYWNSIQNSVDVEDFKDYLAKYPAGQFSTLARRRVAALTSAAKPNTSAPPASNVASNTTSVATPTVTRPPASMAAGMPALPSGIAAGALRSYDYLTLTLDGSGSIENRKPQTGAYYAEDLGGGVQLEMVAVPGGNFMMGSPAHERQDGRGPRHQMTIVERRADTVRFPAHTGATLPSPGPDDEGPQHQVTVPGFYMGKYEVTQAQWRAVAKLPKVKVTLPLAPSQFKGDNLPVETVSWDEAMEFCARLGKATGREYRLPSEAEWEYAARAGTTTPFAFGDTITPEIVNYEGEKYTSGGVETSGNRQRTIAVGSLGAANGFGLYDMHGNVWEWCLDYWHDDYQRHESLLGEVSNPPTDGSAWLSGGDSTKRMLRGGSWHDYVLILRSANRNWITPASRDLDLGFRVVAVART